MNPPSPVSRNSPASTRSNKLSSQPLSTSCCTAARSPASGVSPGRAAPASPLAAPVIASALVLVVIGITPSDPGSRQDPRLVHRTHTQAIRHALLVTEMISLLGLQAPLQHRLDHLRDEPAVPRQPQLTRIDTVEQAVQPAAVDQLLHRRPLARQRGLARTRRPGLTARCPCHRLGPRARRHRYHSLRSRITPGPQTRAPNSHTSN